jgi:hypothetical protein
MPAEWVRLGHWEFRPGDVIAIEHRGDGSMVAYLAGGLKVPMAQDLAAALLADLAGTRTLKVLGGTTAVDAMGDAIPDAEG